MLPVSPRRPCTTHTYNYDGGISTGGSLTHTAGGGGRGGGEGAELRTKWMEGPPVTKRPQTRAEVPLLWLLPITWTLIKP
jgi:hypothetical protein